MESYLKEIRKDVKLKALEGSQTLEADLSGLKSALRDRIDKVEVKKSFIENSAKILEDRIERETNLKEKLKILLDERVESAEKVELIHDRIDKVYDKRLKRLQTHQKHPKSCKEKRHNLQKIKINIREIIELKDM